MIHSSQLKVGDRVHYIHHSGSDPENGIVKEIPDHTDSEVRVVFHCNEEWDNFMDYISQLTPVRNLEMGWIQNTQGTTPEFPDL